MKTPSSDAKPGFEKFFASTDGQRDLCQRLDVVIRQRQEATPGPSSDDECPEEDHKWQCNILHDNSEPPEIGKLRAAIWQPDYWKIECQHYAKALDQISTYFTAKTMKRHLENGELLPQYTRNLLR